VAAIGNVNGSHGAADLPAVSVDSYNLELRDADGFVGDRASHRSFNAIIEDWRERLRRVDEDPLGNAPTDQIKKKKLEELLRKGDPESAGLIHTAIEEFARELALVIRRFLRTEAWQGTERIVIGGGLRNGRIGELAIGRAAVLLKSEGLAIDLVPIRHHPDEAGLLGAAQLMPRWTLKGHDALIGVDIGGSNIRAGLVVLNQKKAADLSKAQVQHSSLWRHANDKAGRGEVVSELVKMTKALVSQAGAEKLKLAPFIGVGCPGIIRADGSIERGGQKLPGGNWEGDFNLVEELTRAIGRIGDDDTMVVMHNDAVVQGLSEVPFMKDVSRWGVATIGTGLGNARFTNRPSPSQDGDRS